MHSSHALQDLIGLGKGNKRHLKLPLDRGYFHQLREVSDNYNTMPKEVPGNRRRLNVSALPTELRLLAETAGLEPATSLLRLEVAVHYTTGFNR